MLLSLAAGCGGGEQMLVDGSSPPDVPDALEALDDAVLTRTTVKRESDLDQDEYRACGVPGDSGDRTVVERTGLHGSSLTIDSGSVLYSCDKIPDPSTAKDPDLPWGGIWCGSSVGRLDEGRLADPRLDLCTAASGDLTAFVWIEPQAGTKWVVVSDAGKREVYEVAGSLPVRVTTTDEVDAEGSASFDVEEYGADGRKLHAYTLDAVVAG